MIKRSAILLLLLAAGSFSLLIFSSYSSVASSTSPVKSTPVKCSGQCKKKKSTVPVYWNMMYPALFPAES